MALHHVTQSIILMESLSAISGQKQDVHHALWMDKYSFHYYHILVDKMIQPYFTRV